MKNKYPVTDGWITARLHLKPGGTSPTEDETKAFLSVGKPELYEFAEYREFKTVIKVIYRKIKQS